MPIRLRFHLQGEWTRGIGVDIADDDWDALDRCLQNLEVGLATVELRIHKRGDGAVRFIIESHVFVGDQRATNISVEFEPGKV